MAEILITALSKPLCTVQEIKSILESQTNVPIIINQEIDGLTALSVALVNRHSVNILQVLLKQGADANYESRSKSPLSIAFDFNPFEMCETQCCNTVKLLLENGANLNGDTSILVPFFCSKTILKRNFFVPMLQIILPYADKLTKTSALLFVLETILGLSDHCYDEEHAWDNSIKAIKLLLESGASPPEDMHLYFIDATRQQGYKCFSEKSSHKFLNLFKTIVPYFLVKKSSEKQNEMSNETPDFADDDYLFCEWENICTHEDGKLMYDSLKDAYNQCLQECDKMQFDILSNKNSLLQTLQNWHERDSSTKVSSEVLYEILLKLDCDKYPHFKDMMSHLLISNDVIELYTLLLRQHEGNANVPQPEVFCPIKQYLSNEDIFNYLFTLLHKNQM